MELFDMRKIFVHLKTGKESQLIDELIEDKITLQWDFVADDNYTGYKTLFKEIEVKPLFAVFPQQVMGLATLNFHKKEISEREFIDQFIETFKLTIEVAWQPDKTHIIFHSSGFDSRILSGCLKELGKRKGKEWLGKIIFICMSPEFDYFNPIMDYLEFDAERLLYQMNYEKTIDFRTVWRAVNGTAAYPDNSMYKAVEKAKKKYKLADTDIQVYTAGFFDEIWDYGFFNNEAVNPFDRWLKKYYHSRYAQFISAIKSPVICPMLNTDSLILILESNIILNKELRLKVLERIDPELRKLIRISDNEIIQNRKLTKKKQQELIDSYQSSHYYQWHRQEVETPTELLVGKFWSHWTAASWIESLLGREVVIE